MSKKPVTMSVARPSRIAPTAPTPPPKEEAPAPVVATTIAADPVTDTAPLAPAPQPPPAPAAAPRLRVGSTARLEQGIKRIVVDVTPSVHKQVKVKAIDYPGGIKEYILRLLEADGLDLSSQPDFIPRPK